MGRNWSYLWSSASMNTRAGKKTSNNANINLKCCLFNTNWKQIYFLCKNSFTFQKMITAQKWQQIRINVPISKAATNWQKLHKSEENRNSNDQRIHVERKYGSNQSQKVATIYSKLLFCLDFLSKDSAWVIIHCLLHTDQLWRKRGGRQEILSDSRL